MARVSRNAFYEWLRKPFKAPSDNELKLIGLFNEKNARYGVRRLKMAYERRFKVLINIKKIKRIKRDFGLITRIRKKNKFRAIFIKGEEHKVAPNLVQRNFSPTKDMNILSVDITELIYKGGRKAYLFVMKELRNRSIGHYKVMERPTLDLVVEGLQDYLMSIPKEIREKTIIHSDQGFHFTSYQFRSILKICGVKQSMSRKGNCLDNAPVESFFGHLKDESEYRACDTFKEVKGVVKKYMRYYNHERPQWSLERKTPAEAGVYVSLVL